MSRHKTLLSPVAVHAMSPAPPIPEPSVNELSDLYVFEHVINRTRRNIKTRNGSSAEIVT